MISAVSSIKSDLFISSIGVSMPAMRKMPPVPAMVLVLADSLPRRPFAYTIRPGFTRDDAITGRLFPLTMKTILARKPQLARNYLGQPPPKALLVIVSL